MFFSGLLPSHLKAQRTPKTVWTKFAFGHKLQLDLFAEATTDHYPGAESTEKSPRPALCSILIVIY